MKKIENKRNNKFVIISTQRSGTTFLTQLLNSHPNIHMSQEIFKSDTDLANVDQDNYRYRAENSTIKEHLDNFYLKYDVNYLATGFVVMYQHIENHPEILEYIKDNNITCIYLERTNQLKTAISRLKARETKLYHTTKKLDFKLFIVNIELLLKELKILDVVIKKLNQITNELSTLKITYEFLLFNQNVALDQIQNFFNIPVKTDLKSSLKKTNDDDLKMVIENYDEVKGSLETTPYKKYLFEDTNSRLIGIQGGAWDEEMHMVLHPKNFNMGLAKFITEIIKPKNLLEFGSGLGFLSRYIVDNSSIEEVYCIEPNKIKGNYRENAYPKLIPINIFTDSHPENINKTFDLVLSIEVAEHIELEKHNELFDFLVNHSNNWIVFSGARVGQGGHGHIAERPEEEWKNEFTQRGMLFEKELTKSIRKACDTKNINHRQNIMIFRHPNKNSLIKKIFTKLFS